MWPLQPMEEDNSDQFTVYKYTDCKHLDYSDYTQDTQAFVLGVQHSLWSQPRTPHFHLERKGSCLGAIQFITCSLGVFVSCSWPGSPSSQTPASLWCTPAYTPRRTQGSCSWWMRESTVFILQNEVALYDYHFGRDYKVLKLLRLLRGSSRVTKRVGEPLVG